MFLLEFSVFHLKENKFRSLILRTIKLFSIQKQKKEIVLYLYVLLTSRWTANNL